MTAAAVIPSEGRRFGGRSRRIQNHFNAKQKPGKLPPVFLIATAKIIFS
jgi:hypothetical protein